MKKAARFGVIFTVVLVDFLGLSFILPLYPAIADKFGLSATAITLLSAGYALMQFLFSPILGRLSDRLGRKPILVLSALGTAGSFVLFGLANSVALLFISRILNGIFGSSMAVAQAYMADVTGQEERTQGMGLLGAALGLGLIFGPAMSGFLGNFGFGVPAYGAAVLSFLNAFLIIFFLKESLGQELRSIKKIFVSSVHLKQFSEVLKHPLMSHILATYFLATFALAAVQNIAILFAEERFHLTLNESGYFFAFLGVVLVLTQGFWVGRLVKKRGEAWVTVGGMVLMAAGYILAPLIEFVWFMVFAAGLMALGAGFYLPALNSLISKNASYGEQGEIFGLAQALVGAALIAGPVFGGGLYDLFGSGSPFFAAAMVTLAALYFAISVLKKLKRLEKKSFFAHD
ncbi:MAG: MFS transporter [Parcubacteria group bacterium]|nr:MFS transporter [Parcubacteria group bacterium]